MEAVKARASKPIKIKATVSTIEWFSYMQRIMKFLVLSSSVSIRGTHHCSKAGTTEASELKAPKRGRYKCLGSLLYLDFM